MRQAPPRSLLFAFYNVENLFDPADDPALPGDDEFTPTGNMKWSNERLDRKLQNVARAIRMMGDGAGPDVIGLCEVENRRVLELLVAEFLPVGEYAIAHAESPDERGIDVAVLYRRTALELRGIHMHHVPLPEGDRPTRDIMEATFAKDGHEFTVLANHWPSKAGGERESEPRRRAAAQAAAGIVDSLTRRNPKADVVLMGDLNDVPASDAVADVLDARGYVMPSGQGNPNDHRLVNTAAPVAEADTIGSYFFRGRWETIDQIMLATAGALDSSGLVLYVAAETVFAPPFLRDAAFDPVNQPPHRTYVKGTRYIGGTSDHFPVMLRVGWVVP